MKKLIVILLLTGCVNLDADHVKKERATYIGMQPFITRGIATFDDAEAKAGELLNESWDARLDAYEARLAR